MRTLDLDFHRKPRPSMLGWILLMTGLAIVLVLTATHYALNRETIRHQSTLRDLETQLAQVAPLEIVGSADETKLTVTRLALVRAGGVWNSLFDTLEAADDKDIAVLSITPNMVRGQVKIYAEARNLTAMLAYIQRLQTEKILRQVTLLDHELVQGDAEAAVRFHISAAWGDSRVRS